MPWEAREWKVWDGSGGEGGGDETREGRGREVRAR